MNHLSEEEMILKHYNELRDEALEAHLSECAECRAELQRLSAALAKVPQIKVPTPPDSYEAQVWAKLRDRLPEKRQSWWTEALRPRQWAIAAVMAVLLVAAFVGGRWWEGRQKVSPPEIANAQPGSKERVVSASLSDHFERTQILLVEVLAAEPKDKSDFAATQAQARDLLDSNRLYRMNSAKTAKDPAVQRTLDELERVLVEIANSPSDVDPKEMDQLQKSIEEQGLLFKVTIIGSRLKDQNKQAAKKPGNKI